MAHFDTYVQTVNNAIRTCGIPTMVMKDVANNGDFSIECDYENSVIIMPMENVGHGQMIIYKNFNGTVAGACLYNVTANFLKIINNSKMLYGTPYKKIEELYGGTYIVYF